MACYVCGSPSWLRWRIRAGAVEWVCDEHAVLRTARNVRFLGNPDAEVDPITLRFALLEID